MTEKMIIGKLETWLIMIAIDAVNEFYEVKFHDFL